MHESIAGLPQSASVPQCDTVTRLLRPAALDQAAALQASLILSTITPVLLSPFTSTLACGFLWTFCDHLRARLSPRFEFLDRHLNRASSLSNDPL